MQLYNVVLRNECPDMVDNEEVTAVARVLQIQVERDFAPYWGIQANVTAVTQDDASPAGAWQIHIVCEGDSKGKHGISLVDGQPEATIVAGNDWPLRASHELLEMLVDPLGTTFLCGPNIDQNSEYRVVSYIVEVCDPCEMYPYVINGVTVSDFVTREYYMENPRPGAPFDFLGRLTKPFDVPLGGYISWVDLRENVWHQMTPTGDVIIGKEKYDPKDPRASRDLAFGSQGDGGHHDLRAVFANHLVTVQGDFSAPSLGDATILLFGTVFDSNQGGTFILRTPDGWEITLTTDAVSEHTLGPGGISQLKIPAGKLTAAPKRPPATRTAQSPTPFIKWSDTIKEPTDDGLYMAQPPQPLDPYGKWSDTQKEPVDDGLYTAQPGGAGGGGMAPFVVAIPHHAPHAATMMPGAMGQNPYAPGATATNIPGYGFPQSGGALQGSIGPGWDGMSLIIWRLPGFMY